MNMRYSLVFFLVLFIGCSRFDPERRLLVEDLRIDVFGTSRELAFTNKNAGFLYTETNAEHNRGWHGWHVMSRKIMDDYLITIDDRELLKSQVHLTQVYPNRVQRAYPIGVQETVTLLDSIDAIVIELSTIKGSAVGLRPLFSGSQNPADYVTRSHGDVILIARKNHLQRTPSADYPVWIGATVIGADRKVSATSVQGGFRVGPALAQAAIVNGVSVAILAAGDTEEQTLERTRFVATRYGDLIQSRKDRMQHLMDRTALRTTDHRLDMAFHWALLSMDALIMQQRKKGIFAGLPWFSNYWGRDSFISLPGATLVQGNFFDAKEILQSFAEWQDVNPASPTFGRIPNLVTPSSISYNTADGTPRFIGALGEYINYSGDTAFARSVYPVVRRAVEGSLKNRIDRNGLLTHGDAETWMDAVGPEGPWSPRGNRANDIQALWYQQLLISSWLAGLADDEKSFREWFSYAEQVRISFNRLFLDRSTNRIYDHLNADNTPDGEFRPNQIFALSLIDDPQIRFNAFKEITAELVYPHGVASVSQNDQNFHPYHHHMPYYVQDAAYHNGIVWTWLAGPWISVATQFGYADTAYFVTQNMIHQILDRGAVGTISELLDAAPREGESEPRLSGTFTQAWSLAEFLRNTYQDYLGVAVDAVENKLELAPHLPASVSDAAFNVAVGAHILRVRYHQSPSEGIIRLSSPAGAPTIDVVATWRLESGIEHNFAYMLAPLTEAELTVKSDGVYVEDANGSRRLQMDIIRAFDPDSSLVPISLAVPVVRPGLKALRGPDHRLLNNEEIKSPNSGATVLYDRTDPKGDDQGPGSFTYPKIAQLRPGSLDITRFTVSADEKRAYFKVQFHTLSDPGWHPEYGFQLTFTGIAIDTDGRAGSGQRTVGRNAQYSLPARHAYEIIVYVGGGIRIEDGKGTVLAEYLPVPGDEANPLGRASSGTLSFAIPFEVIGKPGANWNYAVLVGAQDDHGGAGLGDFRTVGPLPTEWTGGGKRSLRDPNVYDVLLPKP
ncbi:MAG: amylo-alpha-1,6-glucosidase [Bacteroidota bacterium]